jgi:hypothetical protein
LASAGDIHPFIAESLIEDRKTNSRAIESARTKARWEKATSAEWRKLVTSVGKEIKRVRDQQQYALKLKDEERLDYTNAYILVLEKIRARFRWNTLKPQTAPDSIYWQDYATADEINATRDAWQRILDTSSKGKGFGQALLLTHRVNPSEDVKPKITLRDKSMSSPAERLAQGEVSNPLLLMTDDTLLQLSVTGAIDSRIVEVILAERKASRKREELDMLNVAFQKRVADKIAVYLKPRKRVKTKPEPRKLLPSRPVIKGAQIRKEKPSQSIGDWSDM